MVDRTRNFPIPEELESRFWDKVTKTDSCWNWTAAKTYGYGVMSFRGNGRQRTVRAHRVAYELLVGSIPAELVVDHLCRNRGCVNPEHMELVTIGENVLRGIGPTATNARASQCSNGHEYTESNTYHRSDGGRNCRACDAALHARMRRNDQ